MADYKKNGVLISYQKIYTPYIIFLNEKTEKTHSPFLPCASATSPFWWGAVLESKFVNLNVYIPRVHENSGCFVLHS